jgi:hypothetical protein
VTLSTSVAPKRRLVRHGHKAVGECEFEHPSRDFLAVSAVFIVLSASSACLPAIVSRETPAHWSGANPGIRSQHHRV